MPREGRYSASPRSAPDPNQQLRGEGVTVGVGLGAEPRSDGAGEGSRTGICRVTPTPPFLPLRVLVPSCAGRTEAVLTPNSHTHERRKREQRDSGPRERDTKRRKVTSKQSQTLGQEFFQLWSHSSCWESDERINVPRDGNRAAAQASVCPHPTGCAETL